MSEPAFEGCVAEWTNECGCLEDHNYCWPEPLVTCCPELQVTPETPAETVAIIEQSKRVAVQILHAFSGRQFGLCRRVIRPCLDDCQEGSVATEWVDGQLRPTLIGGVWYNDPCSKCGAKNCSCTEMCIAKLPGLVQSITEVRLNGEVVPSWMYRVDNHRELVRTKQLVPLSGPTSAAVVTTQPLTTELCDPSPAPDAILDMGPEDVDGCRVPTATNPSFYWADQPVAEFTYGADSVVTGTAAFYNGQYPLGTGYDFGPVGPVFSAGESITSASQVDGSTMKITVLSGSATRVATPYSFDIVPGTRLRMERLAPATGGCWPKCQDMNADPLTDDNTFQVEYLRGKPVPEGGRWAAGLLACELVKACLPTTGDCKLPDNVTTIAREGITMELAPFIIGGADGKIEFGRTGIPEVDMWLIAVNPHKVRSRSRAYSPDRPNPRRTTWPCP